MSLGRPFNKISPSVWRSERFRGLSDLGKIGYLFLISNQHVTSAGAYPLPIGYACSDLGWSEETYTTVCAELQAAGLVDIDGEIVFIERWFKHNGVMNDAHAAGTRRYIGQVESDRLREKAMAAFDEHNAERIEREAAKAADKEARATGKARTVAELVGRSSHLTDTPFIRRARA